MNKSSVEAAFSLTRNSDGATVPGSFSWNGNEVSFTPAVPLDGGTGYTASVGSGARDSAGTGIESAKTWQFTTATQPVVQVAVPGENATEVLPNASLVVIFDTAMDKPAAEGAFSLKRTANGKPIGGTFGWFGNALIFKPNYSLVGGAQYTVSLSTAARDVAGNPLPAAMTWRFTTTSRPIVESVYPVAGATGVARGSVTIAAFNKSMDKRSAESAFSLKRTSGGASVAGSLAWYGNSLIFTPSTPLAANTRYTAAIAGTAKDLAGKTVANPTTWKYTTGN
jgi:hypothetical protein